MTDWANRIVDSGTADPAALIANDRNWRMHPPEQRRALGEVLDRVGWVQSVVVNRTTGRLVDGHLRVELARERGEAQVPVVYVELDEDEEALILATLDPIAGMARADADILAALMAAVSVPEDLSAVLGDIMAAEALMASLPGGSGEPAPPRPSLADRFGVPPFSVLDARQGYWQERKRQWLSLGIQSELGRGDVMPSGASSVHSGSSSWSGVRGGRSGVDGGGTSEKAAPGGSKRDASTLGSDGRTVRGDGRGRASGLARTFGQDLMRGEHVVGGRKREGLTWTGAAAEFDHYRVKEGTRETTETSGTSVFDPVLCELVYRWFSPPGGVVLDPFAGGSVRGIVASVLGRAYTGVDLSERQLAANRAQGAVIVPEAQPVWIEGDSSDIAALAPGEYDLVFSCPPYADLEVYSDDARDLSTMPYEAFLDAYRAIIAASMGMLKDDRFACFVVGDIRDRKGMYRNFVSQTIAAFEDAGLKLYNEAILVTAVGSLSIRVGRQFAAGRKLGRTHQNVLVFVKGDPRRATEYCGDVDLTKALERFGEEIIDGGVEGDS